jgi:hypothetical protein
VHFAVYFIIDAIFWLSLGTPVSSTNKTDRHDIAEILLKMALNTINQTKPAIFIPNCIIGETISVFTSSVVDRWFDPWLGQTKHYCYYKT